MKGYFDQDAFDVASANREVQEMARRQFGVSLVFGFALLALAGLTALTGSRESSLEIFAQRRHVVVRAEAPPTVAQPESNAATGG